MKTKKGCAALVLFKQCLSVSIKFRKVLAINLDKTQCYFSQTKFTLCKGYMQKLRQVWNFLTTSTLLYHLWVEIPLLSFNLVYKNFAIVHVTVSLSNYKIFRSISFNLYCCCLNPIGNHGWFKPWKVWKNDKELSTRIAFSIFF